MKLYKYFPIIAGSYSASLVFYFICLMSTRMVKVIMQKLAKLYGIDESYLNN